MDEAQSECKDLFFCLQLNFFFQLRYGRAELIEKKTVKIKVKTKKVLLALIATTHDARLFIVKEMVDAGRYNVYIKMFYGVLFINFYDFILL